MWFLPTRFFHHQLVMYAIPRPISITLSRHCPVMVDPYPSREDHPVDCPGFILRSINEQNLCIFSGFDWWYTTQGKVQVPISLGVGLVPRRPLWWIIEVRDRFLCQHSPCGSCSPSCSVFTFQKWLYNPSINDFLPSYSFSSSIIFQGIKL